MEPTGMRLSELGQSRIGYTLFINVVNNRICSRCILITPSERLPATPLHILNFN